METICRDRLFENYFIAAQSAGVIQCFKSYSSKSAFPTPKEELRLAFVTKALNC